jgi:hypothetical protein
LTARLESLMDYHSLALVGGKVTKSNSNASSRMYSLSSLMSFPDEEFDVLGEDELALLPGGFSAVSRDTSSPTARRRRRTRMATGTGQARMASTDRGAITSTITSTRMSVS